MVAKHNPESYDHENPNGPEFTARVFTGQYVKVGGNREVDYVMPDSCCKNTLYNSNEKKCCGGTLHDIISEYECCGWAVYRRDELLDWQEKNFFYFSNFAVNGLIVEFLTVLN